MLRLKQIMLPTLLLFYTISSGQPKNGHGPALLFPPKVDKRIELVSIAFRLAGYPEYNFQENKRYVADIHKHFDPYANHPLITYIRSFGDSGEVRFDAVMAMAIHLTQPPELKPAVPFIHNVPDDRWDVHKGYKDSFVTLLQQFYIDSRFEDFFRNEQPLYNIAEVRYRSVFDSLDLGWYNRFYGATPAGKFHTIIGFGNGRANYGLKVKHPDGVEEIYAVVGTWRTDSAGLPVYSVQRNLPTLVHEFNHSFVNHLNTKHQRELERAGMRIYKEVATQMEELGYPDWKIMLDEALVRAAVIQYIKAHSRDNTRADKELKDQLDEGFVWMKELVALLDEYEQNRKQYPTLERFMPRILKFYSKTAATIGKIKPNRDGGGQTK